MSLKSACWSFKQIIYFKLAGQKLIQHLTTPPKSPSKLLLFKFNKKNRLGVANFGDLSKCMDSTTEATSDKAEKSYLSVAVDSISPWNNSRSSALKSNIHGDTSGLKNQYGGNRITQQSHGPSLKRYPPDCPPLCPRWFHAIDVCKCLKAIH